MIAVNEACSYRRIGKKICVIKYENNEEVLFEFEDDAYQILNCLLYQNCTNLHDIKDYLSGTYVLEPSDDDILINFLKELKEEGIIIDK